MTKDILEVIDEEQLEQGEWFHEMEVINEEV